jgi:Domain of Unknown Function (DUF1206)
MSQRFHVRSVAIGAGALVLSIGFAQHSAGAVAASPASSPTVTFSHGVPVDEQRPGFEPDVVDDPHAPPADDGQRIFTSMGLVGIFVVQAGIANNPNASKGLDQTLRTVATAPFGRPLVAVIAIGFAAYGIYSFFEARYRDV